MERVNPIYEYDSTLSHRDASAPRFNVTETETDYILDGELPGVTDQASVSVTWLLNQVLVVNGTVPPSDLKIEESPVEKVPSYLGKYSISRHFILPRLPPTASFVS